MPVSPTIPKSEASVLLLLDRTAAILSAAQLVILASALLHLRAFAQEHFRYGLGAVIHQILATVCYVALSSRSLLEIRTLALIDRFHQHQTFAAVTTKVGSADNLAVR